MSTFCTVGANNQRLTETSEAHVWRRRCVPLPSLTLRTLVNLLVITLPERSGQQCGLRNCPVSGVCSCWSTVCGPRRWRRREYTGMRRVVQQSFTGVQRLSQQSMALQMAVCHLLQHRHEHETMGEHQGQNAELAHRCDCVRSWDCDTSAAAQSRGCCKRNCVLNQRRLKLERICPSRLCGWTAAPSQRLPVAQHGDSLPI